MSNINVTPGAGAVVATETVGGADFQKIKVFDGTGGSSNALVVNSSGQIAVSVVGAVPVTGTITTNLSSASVVQQGTWNVSVSGVVPVVMTGSVLTLYAPTASLVLGVTSVITGLASVLVLAAPAGAQRNYVTQLLVTNGSGTGTFVSVLDSGQVIYSGYAAASGGGFSASFNPALRQPSLITALYAVSSVQASIIVAASGYTGA